MVKLRNIILVLITMLSSISYAQELKVKSFEETSEALASIHRRENENTGDPCALLRVFMANNDATFENDYIYGAVENRGNEYWIYMAEGAKKLKVKIDGYQPLTVSFSDYGVKKLTKLRTYDLYVDIPSLSRSNVLQNVTFKVNPSEVKLRIDNKEYDVENGLMSMDLGSGQHTYSVSAEYYISEEGNFDLNGKDKTKFINIDLKHVQVPLSVNTDPEGAEIYLDNVKLGNTPYTGNINAGPHSYSILKKNFKPINEGFLAREDKPVSLSHKLNSIIPFIIRAKTSASIKVDGTYIGTSPVSIERPHGKIDVQLSAYGYHSRNTTLNIDGRKTEYYISMKRRFYYKGMYGLSMYYANGNYNSVGLSLCFSGVLSNLEFFAEKGLEHSKKIYWIDTEGNNSSLYDSSNFPTKYGKYTSWNFGFRYGYGMLLGNRFRLTPMIGASIPSFFNIDSSVSDDRASYGFNAFCGNASLKLEYALCRGVMLYAAPEYTMRFAKTDAFKKVKAICQDYDDFSKGGRITVGFHFYLSKNYE